MREIKFRAWDTEAKVMASRQLPLNIGNFGFFSTDEHAIVVAPRQHIVLLQFTGLKDKNGKEIYDGDVLETTDELFDTGRSLWCVKWGKLEEMRGWVASTRGKDYPFDDSICSGQVIGNIYENPELLK